MRPVADLPAVTSLAGSRVLVTGASGLIGSHLLNLLEPGVEAVAVSRTERDEADGVRWVTADLAQDGVIASVIETERPDVVIHLAGAMRGDRTLDAVGP